MKMVASVSIIPLRTENTIYDHITEGIRIISKCDWYEQRKKSTKFSSNFEKKKRGSENNKNLFLMIRKLRTSHIF